ncbi:hypothetical protein ACFXIY_07540 [Streptomyces albidoflavus]
MSGGESSLFGQVNGYSVSYLPPALDCRLSSGGSYGAAVPEALTLIMVGCAVIATTLALIAITEHRHSITSDQSKRPEKRNT